MAKFLLHGLWVPHSGLHLWIEQVEGHRVVVPGAIPEGTFPPAVLALLSESPFRHRLRTTLRTPKGREVSLVLPTAAFAPEQAVAFLNGLGSWDMNPPEVFAPDLRWLIRLTVGLKRFVRAGRLTLKLAYEDNQWWPQFQLSQGLSERGWIAEMMVAAPGILTVNNRNLEEDLVETLPHWIAVAELADLRDEANRAQPWHDFVSSLLYSRPLRRGGVGLLNRLNEWKESMTGEDYSLVIIVEAPEETLNHPVHIDPESALWPVRLQVRIGVDAPRAMEVGSIDHLALDRLSAQFERISAIAHDLDFRVHGVERAYDSTLPMEIIEEIVQSKSAGPWDSYLTTEEIVAFVQRDAERLRKAGFLVLLPKSWMNAELKAKIITSETIGKAATSAAIGLDKIISYDWQLSLGDTDLTAEEMRELVASKTGLVNLRGNWVMADSVSLHRVTSYMTELANSSRKHREAELTKLAMRLEVARSRGNGEEAEYLAALLGKRTQDFNEQHNTLGQVTLAELRELALSAMVEDPVEFSGSTWLTSLLGGADTPAPERVNIPESVHATLREYQRRGVDWLVWMSRNDLGAVLADDMGLGKTLQLLCLLAVEREVGLKSGEKPGPTLVVAPTSVVGNWGKEAAKFLPDLRVIIHHGSERYHGEELVKQLAQTDLMVTSYGVVSRDFKELGDVHWEHVVLDEAQHIKNFTTQASKAVRSLPARQRIALTGTPVENRLSEMWSILDFVNPGILGNASFFRNHFATAIERHQDTIMTERLRRLTAPFIMRRLKTDPVIIDDLPEKTEEVITVTMTSEQAALYKAYVDQVKIEIDKAEGMSRRGIVLASLTRIKQICNHPAHFAGDHSGVALRGRHRSGKVAELMRLLDQTLDQGGRMLIFTQYKAFGDLLQPYLSQHLGEDIPFLHGGVSKTRRDRMVEEFQREGGPSAMLLSLKAGGTGLNLTAANVVVHMDRWWNPAVENQATDRAFRIGQQRNVQVYKLITAGTLEESIQDILDGKTHLAGAVIGEGEAWITQLDPDQLAALMSYREPRLER